jgi:YD repeat-containing protein
VVALDWASGEVSSITATATTLEEDFWTFDRSPSSRVARLSSSYDKERILLLEGLDGQRRRARRAVLSGSGLAVAHEATERDAAGRVVRRRLSAGTRNEEQSFTYDHAGRLTSSEKDEIGPRWSLNRNIAGDIELVDFGAGKTNFSLGSGGRVRETVG